jgi:hypothetical protein
MFSGPYAGAEPAIATTPMAGIFFTVTSSAGIAPSLAM